MSHFLFQTNPPAHFSRPDKQLLIFEYKGNGDTNRVRTVEIDGEIWFVGFDVANVLGYIRPSDAVRQHCKHTVKHRISDNQGVEHEYLVIPESDVYRLIIKSQLPKAEKFENWLFSEVIPTIRKTGRYGGLPVFVRRFNDNWDRVSPGYFSIISVFFSYTQGNPLQDYVVNYPGPMYLNSWLNDAERDYDGFVGV